MKKSLWARYHEETEGHMVIETDVAFIRFSFAPPNCFIHDLYVVPEARGQNHAFTLAEMVKALARKRGCEVIWAEVGMASKTKTEALRVNLRYGFQVHGAQNGFIVLRMDIGGKDG